MNSTVHRSTFWTRLVALTRKESRQVMRDSSSMVIGIALPIVLILLFGYGMSLDINNVPVALVTEDRSPVVVDVLSGLQLSPYFSLVNTPSMKDAENLMTARKVDAILRVPGDFSSQLVAGHGKLELIVHGADATTAQVIEGYVGSALAQWSARRADSAANLAGARSEPMPFGSVTVEHRMWFNAANTSTWYLVPGLVVLIMTIVGAFLMSMVVAREWERGTLESLFVTPVRPLEILLAKMIPNFALGMIGFTMCLIAARFLFRVPIQGSLLVLVIGSMIYLLVVQGIGLLISAATKNQFVASQTTVVTSFLPALMFSGFLFDLNNVPVFIRAVGKVLPATHFLEMIKTLLLAGNVWSIIITDCLLLVAYALLFFAGAWLVTHKRIA